MEKNLTISIIAQLVLKKIKFHVDERGIERVLKSLLKDSSIWDIMWHSRQPIRVVQETIAILKTHELVTFKKEKVILSNKGITWIKKHDITPLSTFVCEHCEGRGVRLDQKLLDQFILLQKNRPEPIQDFGQAYVTAQTTIARISLAMNYGDIDNKDVVVLGAEDDLLGLALAISKRPKKVIVLEIDQRIVDFDNVIAKKLSLPLEAYVVDLQEKLPNKYIGKFDTFFTDPPETIPALKGFILKGVATLKESGSTGYFGFTQHDSSLQKWLKLQEMLSKSKCVITDIIPDFNTYENFSYVTNTPAVTSSPIAYPPKQLWFHSHWYRIVTTPGFGRINTKIKVSESLYNDNEAASY